MNIYVGNLAYKTTEDDLKQAFGAFGAVESVKIISDKYSGRSKGFGFVTMPNADEGKAAINAMNGKEFMGRTLKIDEARPRPEGEGSEGGSRRPAAPQARPKPRAAEPEPAADLDEDAAEKSDEDEVVKDEDAEEDSIF